MSSLVVSPNKSRCWPITVGARGVAAAQFARCGCDVLIQAGLDKPSYDMAVTSAGNLLKIAVRGSDDGCWPLARPHLKPGSAPGARKARALGAVDSWLDSQGARTVYCLVQFAGVFLHEMPRLYLASPHEIAQRMREVVERVGEPVLYEQCEWTQPETGLSCIQSLPQGWLFSPERIDAFMGSHLTRPVRMPPGRRLDLTVTAVQ